MLCIYYQFNCIVKSIITRLVCAIRVTYLEQSQGLARSLLLLK